MRTLKMVHDFTKDDIIITVKHWTFHIPKSTNLFMCLQLIGFKLFLATIFEKNTIPEFEKANKLRQYIIMLKIAPFLISMPNAVIIAIFTHENFVSEFIMNTSEN